MKDIVIKIDRKTSQVFLNKKVLGISGENLQGNLIFEFIDDFVDGVAWLELEVGQTKGYLPLTKEDNSYKLPILSSLLANKGYLTMQLRITESENVEGIPVFKSNEFYLEVKGAINSTETIEEQYPSWVDMVNEKINVIKTDGKGNKYLSDDGTYKYVQGGSSDGGNVDLSNYATKDELDKKVDKVAGKSLIADSEIQRLASVSNYDDTSIRNELNSKADLSDIPAKISELTNDSGFITSIPMEYVTDEELNNKGYLTEHQDISHLANKNEIPTKTSELTNDSGFITDYTEKDPTVPSHVKSITTTDISNWNNKSNFDGNYNNLTNKPTIPTKTSQLTNDSLFASESYVKNEIANAQLGGGDTEIDLSGYATKDELLNKVDKELGKSLISNNEIERLANVTNYDDTAIKNQINSKASISDMTDYIEEHKDELKGDKGDTGERGIQGIQGVQGIQGEKGDDGYTPIKGTDYFTAEDKQEIVNETANKIFVPTKTSELTNDSGFLTSYTETDPLFKASASYKITNGDITNWNSKSNFSGNYNDLNNKPTIPTIPTNVSSFTNDAGYLNSIPTASESVLGGIKVGDGLGINDGLLYKASPLKGKKIAILGDSISAGYLANTNWPTILGENTGATIQNLGSPDATIAYIDGSQDANNFVFISQSVDADSDYLVIMGGGNDYRKSVPIGTNDDTGYITTKGALITLIKGAQALNPNMKIFISTTPSSAKDDTLIDYKFESYMNALEEVARLYHIPFLHLWSNFGLNPQISEVAEVFYQSDGAHLTDAGQTYLADKMQKFLETEVLNNSYNAVTWNGYRLSVLTQAQYTSLSTKDEHTLYILKG